MPLSLYHNGSYSYTSFVHDVDGWSSDYFLMLDDSTSEAGSLPWCGESCTRHTVTVKSDIEQTVYVTIHLWDKRSMGDTCDNLWKDTALSHSYKVPQDDYW